MAAGLSSPLFGAQHLQNYLRTSERTGPDFTDISKTFGNLSSHPGLLARGGTFTDPSMMQQEATGGYLQNRGQIAGNYINNMFGNAALSNQAGSNLSTIEALQEQLRAAELNSSSGMFGALAGLIPGGGV